MADTHLSTKLFSLLEEHSKSQIDPPLQSLMNLNITDTDIGRIRRESERRNRDDSRCSRRWISSSKGGNSSVKDAAGANFGAAIGDYETAAFSSASWRCKKRYPESSSEGSRCSTTRHRGKTNYYDQFHKTTSPPPPKLPYRKENSGWRGGYDDDEDNDDVNAAAREIRGNQGGSERVHSGRHRMNSRQVNWRHTSQKDDTPRNQRDSSPVPSTSYFGSLSQRRSSQHQEFFGSNTSLHSNRSTTTTTSSRPNGSRRYNEHHPSRPPPKKVGEETFIDTLGQNKSSNVAAATAATVANAIRSTKSRRNTKDDVEDDEIISDSDSIVSTYSRNDRKDPGVLSGGGGGRNYGDRSGRVNERKRFYGYKYLADLATKEVHEIIVEIIRPRSPFHTYLDKQELNADWLILLLRIVSKVSTSDFKGNRTEVLEKLCKSQFLTLVSTYLGEVSLESNPKTVASLPAFIGDLYQFYNCLLNTLPSVAIEKDLKRTITKTKVAADNMAAYLKVNVEPDVLKNLDTLCAKYDDYMNAVGERLPKEKERTFLDRIADLAPPENFRELSLYPTYEDITRHRLGFVRPNKVRGAYDSVEHYLDVQFRLMREDFIDPLRTGLRKYLESKSLSRTTTTTRPKFKYDNVRLYPGTIFECLQNSKSQQIGILLNFDPNHKMRRIRWDRSKRFMHGSLLLFTSDDFQTFFYATVLERDLKVLADGKVLIALAENAQVDASLFNTPFLMAESEVFFEPYFLIMKLFRDLKEETFPMKRYIVDGQSHTHYPHYLGTFATWHVGPKIMAPPFEVAIWPTADELGLDAFQYAAFKAALTKDFCVIQGPPGTGKTFLGLKIVEAIWRNSRENAAVAPSLKLPILVVCYTNHALDQFLEGMLKFTQKIVRIGGQSRSEVMQKYNLRGRSNLVQLRRYISSETMFNVRQDIKNCRQQIDRVNMEKKCADYPIGILGVEVLRNVMSRNCACILLEDVDLHNWLLEGGTEVAAEMEEFERRTFGGDGGRRNRRGNVGAEDGGDDNDDEWTVIDEISEKVDSGEKAEAGEKTIIDDDDEDLDEDEEEDRGIVNEDDIFEKGEGGNGDDPLNLGKSSHYSITVEQLAEVCRTKIQKYRNFCAEEDTLLRNGMEFEEYYHIKHQLQESILHFMRNYKILKTRLSNPRCNPQQVKTWSQRNAKMLPPHARWALYWHWLSELRNSFAQRLEKLEATYRNKMAQYEEFKQLEDLQVVQHADVVGMTTTGAARMNLLLKSLHPTVVVVEEAAEVLEAHIVASLTNRCEHVILIGDHEQLKPSAAVYELSKNYNIDVSLFERMIKNGMDCPMLNVQHRMRPEISRLITPLIYPNLQNHESVLEFEPTKGIKKNVFFIEHEIFEKDIDDDVSKQNPHEAEFVICLARYLIQQGYNPENITILTTYAGQMFLLRDLKKENVLVQHVKCVVVDKYQGEENDIVLLSLVRSNSANKIGFLSIKNRVCVALSRAKKGLYMIGNMNSLTKSSELWQNIKKTLSENDAIGEALELYCRKHDKLTKVSCAKDFNQVKEGGCNLYCGELMKCGHICPTLCHIINEDHEQIKCREPCKNTCPRMHPCKLFCYQECPPCKVPVELTLPCQHVKKLYCHVDELTYLCDEIVDDVSPLCNHPVKRKCHEKTEDVKCTVVCADRLDCGHACTRLCHKEDDPDHQDFKCRKPCERPNNLCKNEHKCQKLCFEKCGDCSVKVPFTLPCNHKETLPCSSDISKYKCYKPCRKLCPQCNKECPKRCWQDCAPCETRVKKTIPNCGHEVTMFCSTVPRREECTKKCERIAPCGHKCKSACCKPCGIEKCMELVKFSSAKPLCGHQFIYRFCHDTDSDFSDLENYLSLCGEPCDEILECGDPCGGTCGKCWQGRLHQPCQKKCGAPLICGHSCKYPCRQLCPPCQEPCTFKCKHSHCPKKCGVPCVTCKERCEWRCRHSSCTRKCGEICNRKPCMVPCNKKLKCGHDCIGFCGEPCPPLCRICNEEVTEIMFGYEDEPDARFVLLEDCGHTVESRALDQHLSTSPEGGEIVMKTCPLCKTPITKTLRYMNFVKQTYKHIVNVKRKIFGDESQMRAKKIDLSKTFDQFFIGKNSVFSKTPKLFALLKDCVRKLSPSANRPISQLELTSIVYYRHVFDAIVSRTDEWKIGSPAYGYLFDKLELLIRRLSTNKWCINGQLILDFDRQLRWYHKMVDYCNLMDNNLYATCKNDPKVAEINANLRAELFGIGKFDDAKGTRLNNLFRDMQLQIKVQRSLTSDEKVMIKRAMSTTFGYSGRGHWYVCENGHPYCVTECGSPQVISSCPECRVPIGRGSRSRFTTEFN